MKTSPTHSAGPGRRARITLSVAGALLALVIVAGVALILLPGAPLAGKLAGAVLPPPAGAVPLPIGAGVHGWFLVKPASDPNSCLAKTNEALNQTQLKYMVRAWACRDENNWRKTTDDYNYAWHFLPETADGATLTYQMELLQTWQTELGKPKSENHFCLDVEGAALSNRATVTTFACRSTNNQNQWWYLVQGSQDGQYKIFGSQSRKCLAWDSALSADNPHPYTVQVDCAGATEWLLVQTDASN